MAKVDRPGKGESPLCLPRDYTVVDTETTGLSSETCGLIEVGALRVRDGEVTETFSTLIQPPWREVQRGGECTTWGLIWPFYTIPSKSIWGGPAEMTPWIISALLKKCCRRCPITGWGMWRRLWGSPMREHTGP